MNIDEIKRIATKELEEEEFREAVERYKEKLREKRSLWDRVFPFRIIIVKKENL